MKRLAPAARVTAALVGPPSRLASSASLALCLLAIGCGSGTGNLGSDGGSAGSDSGQGGGADLAQAASSDLGTASSDFGQPPAIDLASPPGPGDGGAPADLGHPFDATPPPPIDGGVWPNAQSSANSDPWLAANHELITEMRPRVLVINFANGIGTNGGDNTIGGPLTKQQVQALAQKFADNLSRASIYQPALHPNNRPFLIPQITRVIDLQDANGHANSAAFPRGPADPNTGYPVVGYGQLFSQAFAQSLGYLENGRFLTLGELVDRGLVHDVIIAANQVDGRAPNPPDQVTSQILEVAFVTQAYDAALKPIAGEFVKNGIDHIRQKTNQYTWQDANSMPWTGRSLRIFFMNVSRGAGCLLHSFGHAWEFLYNESRIYSPNTPSDGAPPNPWLTPYFRQFADFDMKGRYKAPFDSLYAGGDKYTYGGCANGYCTTLNYPMTNDFPAGSIANYQPNCGNVHYPPGAAFGYDYAPVSGVESGCTSFLKANAAPEPYSKANYANLTADPTVDKDCGGDFLVYWYENMPGRMNESLDLKGRPMKNWWPFLYY